MREEGREGEEERTGAKGGLTQREREKSLQGLVFASRFNVPPMAQRIRENPTPTGHIPERSSRKNVT